MRRDGPEVDTVAVGVAVGVLGRGVDVAVGVAGRGVGVAVRVPAAVAVRVAVGVGVNVGVAVAPGVFVGPGVLLVCTTSIALIAACDTILVNATLSCPSTTFAANVWSNAVLPAPAAA